MSSDAKNEKIIMIPKEKYVKITYLLLLLSSIVGILDVFLSILVPVSILTDLSSLSGLAGLVLVLLGLFLFKNKFNEQQLSHFKYLGAVFVIFLLIGIVMGVVLGEAIALLIVISIPVTVISMACVYVGYRLNERGEIASKDAAIAELKALKP